MKKFILILIASIIIAGGIWYVKHFNKTPVDQTITTYKNFNLGINFAYPKILSASTTADSVTLHHEVTFTHHDYCDFKGEGSTTIPSLTDFNVKFKVLDKNLVDSMKSESPYIPEENFVNGAVVPSPGFIDTFETVKYKGFAIFEGAEGCGHTIYYLEISSTKTLVITSDLITVFTGAIDAQNMKVAEAVPGVLNKEKNQTIFGEVMKTVVVN